MTSVKHSLKIDWATHAAAKYACENWHYSKTMPSTLQKRVAIGAWEDGSFIGIVLFGHGANPSIGNPYGLTINQCVELTRIALKSGHKNHVSRIVRFALDFLRKSNPKLRLVVSYADTGQGHHGGVYQAGNWIYTGISAGVSQIWFNGRAWHAKALRTSFPNIKMSDPRVKKLSATDKHKYLMPLDDAMRSTILPLSKPYPKRVRSSETSGDHPEERQGSTDPDAPNA